MTKNSKHFIVLGAAIIIVFASLISIMPSSKNPQPAIESAQSEPQKAAAKIGEIFEPHKALYEIKLASTRSGSQIVNISGKMLYEWKPTCEAWTSNHRFNINYEYADTPTLSITSEFSTYESYDGTSLNFTSQRKRGGEVFEQLRGQASIQNKEEGQATFTIPQGLEHDLPAGTLFPVAHTINVAKKVREGAKFYNAIIYDGSDEKGPVEVNTFIGSEVNALSRIKESPDLDMSLINTPARLVRLAFFPMNDEEQQSDYEMDLVFHNNGVISDMLIDYDDFSVSQSLIAIEKLETDCEK